MNQAQLLHEVKEFRLGILDGKPATDMCFAICAPLVGYLNFIGYTCKMVEGRIDGVQHFWLVTADGIIDPTADQFDQSGSQSMPSVYIGPQPVWYNLKELER